MQFQNTKREVIVKKILPSLKSVALLLGGMAAGFYLYSTGHSNARGYNEVYAYRFNSVSLPLHMESENTAYGAVREIRDVSGGYRRAITLLAGVRLGIFTALSGRASTAQDLSTMLKTETRATEILLNALASIGFLEKTDGKYSNSAKSENYLVRNKTYYLGDILSHEFSLIGRWLTLPEVVLRGNPVPPQYRDAGGDGLKDFILGMANIAQTSARQTLNVLDLTGVSQMLDLGGGPGTYSIIFCRRYPELRAVVFDRPEVTEIAGEQIAAAGMMERITTLSGDFFINNIGSDYDLVFISNIIHSLGKEAINALLKKSFQSLKPGGRIVVKDFILDEDMTSPQDAALFSINMLTATREGRCYAESEVRDLLGKAGCKDFEYKIVNEEDRLVIGRKTGQ